MDLLTTDEAATASTDAGTSTAVPNPTRAEPGWPPAVVLGGFQTGVLALRTLKRRGVRACCVDCNPANPAFRSVYGPAQPCPDPDADPVGWVRAMADVAAAIGERAAIIPSSDQFVSAIARHADTLADHFLLSAGVTLQGLLADKQTQYELAARHAMPMPRTVFARTVDEVRDFARVAVFPCVLKPTHFREWLRLPGDHPLFGRKISVATSDAELLESYRLASTISSSVILQEMIEGPDSAKRVYLSCYDESGRRIANAMFRELRCDPLGLGPATVTEPVVDPEVDEVCDRFLRRLGYVGLCEFEMKRDTRDGRVKLIEANPRLSGGGDAAPYAGVDLCWLHYLDLIGRRVAPVAPAARDFRHVVLRTDARAVVAYRRAGLITWRDVLRSYRPPLAFFDLDTGDWRYSAETVYVAARLLLDGIVRTLLRRPLS